MLVVLYHANGLMVLTLHFTSVQALSGICLEYAENTVANMQRALCLDEKSWETLR